MSTGAGVWVFVLCAPGAATGGASPVRTGSEANWWGSMDTVRSPLGWCCVLLIVESCLRVCAIEPRLLSSCCSAMIFYFSIVEEEEFFSRAERLSGGG